MKKFLYRHLILLISAILFSCSTENLSTITIDQSTLDTDFLKAIPAAGGSTDMKFTTNSDWNITVDETKASSWLTVTPSSGKAGNITVSIKASKNNTNDDLKAEITIHSKATPQTITVSQLGVNIERDALIALYNSAGGDNWTKKDNWCSEKPLAEWYGVKVSEMGNIISLSLFRNNLIGTIAPEISNLTELQILSLQDNKLSGSIPASLEKLTNLESLFLNVNSLSGSIPPELGNLTNLRRFRLGGNKLTGAIPIEIGNLKKLEILCLEYNQLTGSIPKVFFDLDNLNTLLLDHNKLSGSIPEGIENLTKLKNLMVNNNDFSGSISKKLGSLLQLKLLYMNDNDLTGSVPEELANAPELKELRLSNNKLTGKLSQKFLDHKNFDLWLANVNIMQQQDGYGIIIEEEKEERTEDGYYYSLQSATYGNGINIVLVGDGFLKEDMGIDGKYEQRMSEAMEHFFSEEPYRTFRNRFNVYVVKAISETNDFSSGNQTVFGSKFGDGTRISGYNDKIFNYAFMVPDILTLDDLTVINILNSPKYAGTCWMYYDNNASISYCPTVEFNNELFREILIHEAGGHGFAKLGDEYSTPSSGTITAEKIKNYERVKKLGWQANVDIKDTNLRWSHFYNEPLYKNTLGLYIGALTYEYGAYRPNNTSIMVYNKDGYNAPSREAIFERIITLSGETYTFGDFVRYDGINRRKDAARKSKDTKVDMQNFVPLGNPVIVW